MKRSKGRDIIVVGTSAGGLEALDQLVAQLPGDLQASLFIVQHMAPHNSGEPLLRRLRRHRVFQPRLAEDGERFKPGRVYVAPPDNHLLLKKAQVLVTKGARENRYRPGIDPLFRSAAVAHGSRVIGVVLTGMLDDGTAGLMAIKRCGGVTVVQDPSDAAYSGMPVSALDNVDVDFCVPIAEMGRLLTKLVVQPLHRSLKRSTLQRLGETQGYIDRIRGMLLADQSNGPEDTLTRVKGLMANRERPSRRADRHHVLGTVERSECRGHPRSVTYF